MTEIQEVEQAIGYKFKDIELGLMAITHKSYAYEKYKKDVNIIEKYNERIEFLGDAVLEHIVSVLLYLHRPLLNEGEMTRKRAKIVCENSLSSVIKDLGIGKYIRLGRCEITKENIQNQAILADVFEAILGAVYLDSDFETASNICTKLLSNVMTQVLSDKELNEDYKTKLQELLQQKKDSTIKYKLEKEEGPAHNKQFFTCVYVNSSKVGEGNGKTKKISEQNAAKEAIQKIKSKD